MTIDEIKSAVDAGHRVHWIHHGYRVRRDRLGRYHIIFLQNQAAIGMTNRAGDALNGREADFFIAEADTGQLSDRCSIPQRPLTGCPES